MSAEQEDTTAPKTKIVDDSNTLETLVKILQKKKVVKVIADPTIVTTSGRPTSFRSGGEIPIPIPQADGKMSIEWREFGIGLEVVSTVLDNNRIRLEVAPEVGTLDYSNAVQIGECKVPALTISRANTQVEMKSGQTLVINGLKKGDENLVILITPELVESLKSKGIRPMPNHEVPHPLDIELYRYSLPAKPIKPTKE